MIGKSLRERYVLAPLAREASVAVMTELLASHAEPLVQVRARDARMIAFVVVRADEASVRLCKSLGFRVAREGTLVFGLLGADAARLFGELAHVAPLSRESLAWLETPCAARESKVVLLAGGIGLVSVDTTGGRVAISVHDAAPAAPR